jgi:hypothetical protein
MINLWGLPSNEQKFQREQEENGEKDGIKEIIEENSLSWRSTQISRLKKS